MRRLGNLQPKKEKTDAKAQDPLITLMKGKSHSMTLNKTAASKIGVGEGDRVDILEGDTAGEYFIAKSVDAALDKANEALPKEQKQTLRGRKVSKSLTFTSTYVHPLLKNIAMAFEVSDSTVDFEGLKWYRLVPTVVNDEAEVAPVEAKVTKEKVPTTVDANENF